MSLTRYRVLASGAELPGLERDVVQTIRTMRFVPFGSVLSASSDEAERGVDDRDKTSGWTPFADIENPEDADVGFDVDGLVVLSIREDARRIPPAFLKREQKKLEDQWKTRFNRERLARAEREEIKQNLIKKYLGQALPSSRRIDFLWDKERAEAILFSPAGSARELFERLFEKTFGHKLRRVGPVLYSPDDAETLENAGMHELRGREFLRFLWGRSFDGELTLGDAADIVSSGGRISIRADLCESKEALSALASGGFPTSLSFIVSLGREDVHVTLDEHLLVKGYKSTFALPDRDDPDRDADVLVAYQGLRSFLSWMDAMWEGYLEAGFPADDVFADEGA